MRNRACHELPPKAQVGYIGVRVNLFYAVRKFFFISKLQDRGRMPWSKLKSIVGGCLKKKQKHHLGEAFVDLGMVIK
ncbi:hypothetical protein WN944_014868 [Citrus x changshan-huyou]|uniref:Uncharacterized protein n=1 Tax=Citrus x changshan-huyou TaxID=2935761 RepID=A0AAP0MAN2_9ROSI